MDLRDNVISQTGASALIDTIKYHPGLKVVHLENNRIDAALCLKIQDLLGQERSLRSFASTLPDEIVKPATIRVLLLGAHTVPLCQALGDKLNLVSIHAEKLLGEEAGASEGQEEEDRRKMACEKVKEAISMAEKEGRGWVLSGYPLGMEEAGAMNKVHCPLILLWIH